MFVSGWWCLCRWPSVWRQIGIRFSAAFTYTRFLNVFYGSIKLYSLMSISIYIVIPFLPFHTVSRQIDILRFPLPFHLCVQLWIHHHRRHGVKAQIPILIHPMMGSQQQQHLLNATLSVKIANPPNMPRFDLSIPHQCSDAVWMFKGRTPPSMSALIIARWMEPFQSIHHM